MSGQKDIGTLFFIECRNAQGMRGILCKTPEGTAFSNMICGETTYFYSFTSASVEANKMRKKFKNVKVVNMQSLIDNPDKGKEYGITSEADISDGYFVVGYTDDGIKHWIHYNAEEQHYFPAPQEAGACVWHCYQTDNVIERLKQDKTISIKEFSVEKIEKKIK